MEIFLVIMSGIVLWALVSTLVVTARDGYRHRLTEPLVRQPWEQSR